LLLPGRRNRRVLNWMTARARGNVHTTKSWAREEFGFALTVAAPPRASIPDSGGVGRIRPLPPRMQAWSERRTPIRRVSARFQSMPDRSPALQ
jgi:hypothetical protein